MLLKTYSYYNSDFLHAGWNLRQSFEVDGTAAK
jgi:hypothetical protein